MFSIFSGRKLKFPSMKAETFSLAICSSLFFILSLRCVSLFVFLFSLSLGCRGTCLTKMRSSFFCFLVSLANLSLGCRGTCLTNMTSSSFLFFVFCLTFPIFLFRFLHFVIILFACCCTKVVGGVILSAKFISV